MLFSSHVFEIQEWTSSALPTLATATAIPQLLMALPSIAIKDASTFVDACQRWLRLKQCRELFEKEQEGLRDFLINNLVVEDWESAVPKALQHLTENVHRFGGKTRGDFLVWAAKRLRRLPELRHYATLRDYLSIGIDDFESKSAKDALADFTFTAHDTVFGMEYHIPIATESGPVIWRVLDLDWAKSIWPVVVQRTSSGKPYLAKIVRGHTVLVHRLLFKLNPHDVVVSHDGDYTNFSMYPYSQKVEAFWGDWEKPSEKSKSALIPAKGMKPMHTEIRQAWLPNLYLAHDRWGVSNSLADDRQETFEETRMFQPLQVEDEDEKKALEFGGMPSGYAAPVATQDVVRATLAGKNTPVTWKKLDREDQFESTGVQKEMASATIRDINREIDQAQSGDEAGEERKNVIVANRPTLVDEVEMDRA